jgi:hypothetical protein
MTNIERARLLIRVANQIGDGADRRALLAWADGILLSAESSPPSSPPGGVSFPIPIFRTYKGRRYDGLLLDHRRVQLNGKIYSSPSAAATSISDQQENGQRVWRYKDEATGEIRPIGRLRES